jgi:hypothetical protein
LSGNGSLEITRLRRIWKRDFQLCGKLMAGMWCMVNKICPKSVVAGFETILR